MSFQMKIKSLLPGQGKFRDSCLKPFHVAEVFTGTPGKYVPVKDTVTGFKEIIDGKHDDLPEGAFLYGWRY